MAKRLTPLKQKVKRKTFIGFDCETYSKKNKFQCMAFYQSEKDEENIFSTDKGYFHELLEAEFFRGKTIVCTNLVFDFNVLLERFYVKQFDLLLVHGKLLSAKAMYDTEFKRICHRDNYNYLMKNILSKRKHAKNKKDYNYWNSRKVLLERRFYKIEFIDTMAYANMGVKKIGKIIGVDKLECPFELGLKCKTEEEFNLMKTYNMNDAKISKLFMDYFQEATIELGGSLKATISSSAVNLFRCKYLKQKYYCNPKDVMDKIFNAFYGGRTEAFYHGKFTDKMKMYDINSLYPFSMLNDFPNPNTMRKTTKTSIDLINKFDGVSHIKIWCPNIHKPLLPIKTQSKLYFPKGDIEGWYSHLEIRKALTLGYIIKEIKETIYYEKNCRPFDDYILDLYKKRLEYKKANNPMADATKLFMNSFYGKLGESYKNKEMIVCKEFYKFKEGDKVTEYDKDFLRVVRDIEPKNHCMPIWAVYVTAYARLKLYEYLEKYDVLYCDTDSIVCNDEVPTSNDLGDMKLELEISEGYIIRPKFYALKDLENKNDKVKIKGLPLHYNYDQFKELLKNNKVDYEKFVKMAEGLKRELDINEILMVSKTFECVDTKRNFESQKTDKLYSSSPFDTTEIKEKPICYTERKQFEYLVLKEE